jgi:hypothetical protein
VEKGGFGIMSQIWLVVKGERYQALQAAVEHRVEVSFAREIVSLGGLEARIETYLEVPEVYAYEVAKWFTEDLDLGAPYAAGSCLFYAVEAPESPLSLWEDERGPHTQPDS